MAINGKIPDELKGANHEAVVAWVSDQAAKKLVNLAKLSASDPAKYASELTKVMVGQDAQIKALEASIKKDATDSKAAEAKALVDAEVAIKAFGVKLEDVANKAFSGLSEEFLKLPETISGYVLLKRVQGQLSISGITATAFTDATKTKGKSASAAPRGRKSKWLVNVTVEKGQPAKAFDSISDARVVFLKAKDRETTYSKDSFAKQCENYEYGCSFTERTEAAPEPEA